MHQLIPNSSLRVFRLVLGLLFARDLWVERALGSALSYTRNVRCAFPFVRCGQ